MVYEICMSELMNVYECKHYNIQPVGIPLLKHGKTLWSVQAAWYKIIHLVLEQIQKEQRGNVLPPSASIIGKKKV